MFHTLYKTTNAINGKFYVGVHSTNNPNDLYLGSGLALKRAIKKYGKQYFTKEILMCFDSQEDAYEVEEILVCSKMIERKDVYNSRVGGMGATSGMRFVYLNETRKVIQIDKTKFDPAIHTWYVHSDESKARISKGNSGKVRSEEVKQQISNALIGRIDPPETKLKKKKTQAQKDHLSKLNRGNVHSEESKQKMSLSRKGKPKSPEHRQKLAEGNRSRAAQKKQQKSTTTNQD